MRMCILASGSSGNCTLLRVGGRTLVIDAGIGPRTCAQRLDGTGAAVCDVSDMLLTHLDTDHFTPTWFRTIERLGIRVHLARSHLHHFYRAGEQAARRLQKGGQLRAFDEGHFTLGEGEGDALHVRTLLCPHDETGSVSYRIDSAHGRLAYATDVGHVRGDLVESMTGVDLLAIESNYDPRMEIDSPRPEFLKQRIMGGAGHLSNEQARDAVLRAVERSAEPPRHVVLLHLSRQCNHPDIARAVWNDHPQLASRLRFTSQFERTGWLAARHEDRPVAAEQMAMW